VLTVSISGAVAGKILIPKDEFEMPIKPSWRVTQLRARVDLLEFQFSTDIPSDSLTTAIVSPLGAQIKLLSCPKQNQT
jgi:hypothetical protein